jgi:plastocyanin
MKSRDRFRAGWILALALVFVALGGGACNSSSPTSPYGGGGGGGGGGTTFNLGPFGIGQSASFTFASAGTFGYHCIPHRAMGMTGTVQVDAGGADSLVVQIGPGNGLTFSPASAHIKPGGHVRWVNASNLTIHTVTND